MLAVDDLHCERDERVLFSRLSFDVTPGSLLQVQGANGSGKTTLLRILAGLNQDFTGNLYWQGRPRASVLNEFQQSLFYLGHAPSVNRTLTPLQNLRWFCALQGYADDSAILAALTAQGLAGYAEIPCYQLSAGQQRRVSLARLELTAAALWILDEPFTALDRLAVAALELRLSRHAAAGGAVVLTTHHPLKTPSPLSILDLDAQRPEAL
jgi:heme exporter protein A